MKTSLTTLTAGAIGLVLILAALLFAWNVFAATRWSISLATNPNLSNGLVNWWTMDAGNVDLGQAAAEVRDSIGSSHGNWLGHGSTTAAGRIGQAIDFDGTDDYIDFSDPGSGIKTIAFWIKADDTTSRKIININMAIPEEIGQQLVELNASSVITATSFPGTTVIYIDGAVASTLTTGWHHVVITDTTGVDPTSDFEIGGVTPNSTDYFDGKLDDVRIYNRVLSAAEIKRLYHLGATTFINKTLITNPANADGLVGHWTFDGPTISGATIVDQSGNSNNGSAIGEQLTSLRFNDDDVARLTKTFGGAPTDPDAQTISFWVKRTNLGLRGFVFAGNGGASTAAIRFDTTDKLQAPALTLETTQVFRDPAAWVHIVLVWDSDNGTAGDRLRLYIDGTRVTVFDVSNMPSAGADSPFLSATGHRIGDNGAGGELFDGYLADFYAIDGQALGPTSFGKFDDNGNWHPINYQGTYGSNGFHLDFGNASDLGNDVSGNNNDWTQSNVDATDQSIDTPTNNFAILMPHAVLSGAIMSQAATKIHSNASAYRTSYLSIMATSTTKLYFEVYPEAADQLFSVGLRNSASSNFSTENSCSNTARYCILNNGAGTRVTRFNNTDTNSRTADASWDVIQTAFDPATGKLWFGRNNTWYGGGDPSAGTSPTYTVSSLSGAGINWVFDVSGGGSASAELFLGTGQFASPTSTAITLPYRSDAGGYFVYAPPTDFKALSTSNLPEVDIAKPSDYFDVVKYTGNGSTQSISSLAFQPGMVWLKDRTTTNSNGLFDAVRGATILTTTDNVGVETTDADTLTAFNSNGFSLGADTKFNTNTNSYVSWNWKEDNTTSGFDIITWTGDGTTRNLPHGLGVTPAFAAVKLRSNTTFEWRILHEAADTSKILDFSTTAGSLTPGGANFQTPPWDSSNLKVLNHTNTNNSGFTYLAYLFAEKEGFSKFDKYTGNGSADGPFVYLGFKPRWLLIKRTDTTGNWVILDTEREGYNVDNDPLFTNSNAAEGTTDLVDILTNGFKVRTTNSDVNTSSGTYIYAAFAEEPFSESAGSLITTRKGSPGRIGQAIDFDGVDDYISFSDPGSGIRTIAFWIKADDATSRKVINIDGTDQIELNAQGNIAPTSFPGTTVVYMNGATPTTTPLVAGTWYHVVITDTTGVDPTSSFEIGRVGSSYFDGTLDDVRIYNRALSAADVKRLYHLGATTKINTTIATNPNNASGLVGHWTFDGKTMYQNVQDVSGTGNTGYISGQTSTTTAPGRIGQALDFDGVNDQVLIPTFVTTVRSIAFWMKADDTTLRTIMGFSVGEEIYLNSSSEVAESGFLDTTIIYVDGAVSPSVGTGWHHVVITNATGLSVGELKIGSDAFDSANFDGRLDDVRIYNRALSASEVKRLYQLGR